MKRRNGLPRRKTSNVLIERKTNATACETKEAYSDIWNIPILRDPFTGEGGGLQNTMFGQRTGGLRLRHDYIFYLHYSVAIATGLRHARTKIGNIMQYQHMTRAWAGLPTGRSTRPFVTSRSVPV
ncbi:hypothetical protein EVAR_4072_1 [Eumeta japonica]|uniref:Uncharacterized protein n=1 Tax=Eumeta variegata TaxID=151549 RepID=A0A4C1T7G2_EUMVA|nr:hypothetical protein EVAR_4072_1 [Eumeta japonica]